MAAENAAQGRRALLRNTGWQVLTQFLPLLINLVLTPYVIHGLGERLYGVYLLAIAVQAFCGVLGAGVGLGANRFFSLYVGAGDRAAMTRLLSTLLGIGLVFSLVFCAVFFALAGRIADFFPATDIDPDGAVFLLRTMVVLLAVVQLRGLFLEVLFVHQRFKLFGVTSLVSHLIYAAGLIYTVETGAGLRGVALSFVVQAGPPTLIVVFAALRYLDRSGIGLADRATVREYFGYTWKFQSTNVLEIFSRQSDTLVVGRFAARELTPFGAGYAFADTLRTLALSAQIPIFSQLGRLVGAHGADEASKEAGDIQRFWVLAVTGYVALGAPAAFAGVNSWLDLGVLPGVVASLIFVGHGFWLLGLLQSQWALVLGRSDLTLAYQSLNLVVNVGLTLVLVSFFGALGTAAATLIAQACTVVALVHLVRTRVSVPLASPWSEIRWVPLVIGCLASVGTQYLFDVLLVPQVIPHGPFALLGHAFALVPVLAFYVWRVVGFARMAEIVLRRRPAPFKGGQHRRGGARES